MNKTSKSYVPGIIDYSIPWMERFVPLFRKESDVDVQILRPKEGRVRCDFNIVRCDFNIHSITYRVELKFQDRYFTLDEWWKGNNDAEFKPYGDELSWAAHEDGLCSLDDVADLQRTCFKCLTESITELFGPKCITGSSATTVRTLTQLYPFKYVFHPYDEKHKNLASYIFTFFKEEHPRTVTVATVLKALELPAYWHIAVGGCLFDFTSNEFPILILPSHGSAFRLDTSIKKFPTYSAYMEKLLSLQLNRVRLVADQTRKLSRGGRL